MVILFASLVANRPAGNSWNWLAMSKEGVAGGRLSQVAGGRKRKRKRRRRGGCKRGMAQLGDS